MVTAIVALAALVLAPLIAYLTAGRKLSGRIATSEAGQLWDESAAIRADYRLQIATANERLAGCEGRVAELERDNNALARENIDLRAKVRHYEQTIEQLRRRVDEQAVTIAELRQQIGDYLQTKKE